MEPDNFRLLFLADTPEKLTHTYGPGIFMPPLGLCSLSAYLKEHNREWDIRGAYLLRTLDEPMPDEELLALVNEWRPTIVGFSAMSSNFRYVAAAARLLKEKTGISNILGGVHLSSCPNDFPECFDLGVIGEGELTLSEILKYYQEQRRLPDHVAGTTYWREGRLVRTAPREFCVPLDRIPRLDLALFPPGDERAMIMHSSRGCPYSCVFCNAASLWGKARAFSAERVVEDIRYVHDHYGMKKIAFFDELFIADRRRLELITDGLEKIGLTREMEFECLVQASLITREVARLMKRMNFTQIDIGIETGSQRVLDYLKKGRLKVAHVRRAVSLFREMGIKRVTGGFMVGTPGESREDILQSIALIKELKLYFAAVNITTPYPGTELWQELQKNGKIAPDEPWTEAMFGMTYFADEELWDRRLFNDIERGEFITLYRQLRQTADIINARRRLPDELRKLFTVADWMNGPRATYRQAKGVYRTLQCAVQRVP